MKYSLLFFTLFFSFISFAQETVRPWIGIYTDKVENGVLVKEVISDTPADKAGIKAESIITHVNKKKVKNIEELIKNLIDIGVGNTAKITLVTKAKKEKTYDLVLVARPGMLELAKSKLLNKGAPNIELPYHKDPSQKFKLSVLKDKKTVVMFWATWCVSCQFAKPVLEKFASNHPDINVIAINNEKISEDKKLKKKIKKNIKEFKNIKFLNAQDSEVASEYLVTAIPYFVLINGKGEVAELIVGVGEQLEKTLEQTFKSP
ncbi:MAG: hypothetical protein CME62_13920 [Halobacteriovoraceae bacterium]|nr:hypothetical protein [Halobacteriovoraceae bacterium]|tara:strand:+ start:14541 stop:15323 length:783 start_codon:yes stop_codon:yes gene_type:complete